MIQSRPQQNNALTGLTLVEMLLAMTLMFFLTISVSNFVIKGQVMMLSLAQRTKTATEVYSWIEDIRVDFQRGAYISDNSHSQKLEYTTYDPSTSLAVKKIYDIYTSSGKQYLRLSLDGGTTWESPYRISSQTQYQLTGTPQFLYAAGSNECTLFTDTNGNDYWQSGVDAAGTYSTCPNGMNYPLQKPSLATKIDIKNFVFTTGKGNPEAIRTLPADIFVKANPGLVRSQTTPVAGVKDSSLVQKFTVNTVNSLISTTDLRDIAWDPIHERLALVSANGATYRVYLTERNGVIIGNEQGVLFNDCGLTGFSGASFEADGKTLLLANTGGNLYRSSNIDGQPPIECRLIISGILNNSAGFDPGLPDSVFAANNTSGIQEYNKYTGAALRSWDSPTGATLINELDVEPLSGDILMIDGNVLNCYSSNKCITLYRLKQDGTGSSNILINISDLGLTTIDGIGLAYDSALNRIFLSAKTSASVYEIVPDRLLTARNGG